MVARGASSSTTKTMGLGRLDTLSNIAVTTRVTP
jgi:hypothetical protein